MYSVIIKKIHGYLPQTTSSNNYKHVRIRTKIKCYENPVKYGEHTVMFPKYIPHITSSLKCMEKNKWFLIMSCEQA